MISIEDKHLVLQPKLNSAMAWIRLPLVSAYKCPMCEEIVQATVKLNPAQLVPKINLYHENVTALLVHYNAVPLNPANGEQGVLFMESGHNRPGKLSDSGRSTTGVCGVTKMVIEPDPLRRVLQFFRIMLQDFPQDAPYNVDTIVGLLEQHPERAELVEDYLTKKGCVVMPDEAGGTTPAYLLRYMAWGGWTMIQAARAVVDTESAGESQDSPL